MRHAFLVYFDNMILCFACVKVGQSRVRSRFQYGLLHFGQVLGWFGVLVYQVEPQRLQVLFMVYILVRGWWCLAAWPAHGDKLVRGYIAQSACVVPVESLSFDTKRIRINVQQGPALLALETITDKNPQAIAAPGRGVKLPVRGWWLIRV